MEETELELETLAPQEIETESPVENDGGLAGNELTEDDFDELLGVDSSSERAEQGQHSSPAGENAGGEGLSDPGGQDPPGQLEPTADQLIASLQMRNPFTNQPITNVADIQAYRQFLQGMQAGAARSLNQPDSAGTLQYPRQSPEPPMVREALERMTKQRIQSQIERDVREISRYDPTVKSAADLHGRPEYGELCRMVGQGYTLADAWKLKNMEAISRQEIEAAKQSALNSLRGKQHLAQSVSRGIGAAPVPPEVAEQYRVLMPDISDAEIQRDYNEYLKSIQGRE